MFRFLSKSSKKASPDTAVPVFILDEEMDALPFDRITCPDLKAVAEVWLSLPRTEGEILPRWSSFSPAMVKPQLDKVCILQVGDLENHEIEFTLYGNHPTEVLGNGKPLKLQEMRVDQSQKHLYVDIFRRTGRSIANKAPQFARKAMSWKDLGEVEYELVMLPFETENGVTRILQPLCSTERRLSA